MTPIYFYILLFSIAVPLLYTIIFKDFIKYWKLFTISTRVYIMMFFFYKFSDLGTSSTADPTNGTYNWGETIKGSYDGTLYFLSSTPEGFTIPVPIKIQFSAFRYAQ